LQGTAADHRMELTANAGDVKFHSTSVSGADGLDLDLSVGTLAQVGTLLELENLPEEDLSLKGRVSLDGPVIQLSGLVAELGTMTVNVDGTVDTATSGIALTVDANGSNIDILGPELPEIPFTLETTVKLADSKLDLDPLNLTFGESQLNATLHADLQDIPDIKLEAQAPLIDLAPFFPAEEEGEESEDTPPDSDGDQFVFKDEPLPIDTLSKANANVDVAIDTLRTANVDYTEFIFRLNLADGQLDAENTFKGMYGGTFDNKVTMTLGGDSANLDIGVHAGNLKLVALSGKDIEKELIPASAVDVTLKGSGNTPRAIASSADGKILFMQGPGRMSNALIGKLSGDIIAQLFNALNPFAKDEEYSNWDCSVFGVDFNSGEGEISSFLLQGEKIMVVGGGSIDLNTEKLNVEFNTKPRKGVGISADMFVTPFVALSGTLADPHVGLNKKGALLSGGAAILTGGLSFLYKGVADRATAEAGKCEETFEAIDMPIPGGAG
jgi:uncharacterized protein involved in outer membrane biogenesis